jgi:hypothetical protein
MLRLPKKIVGSHPTLPVMEVPGLITQAQSSNNSQSASWHKRSNQSVKPTAPWRSNFSVFATTPCRMTGIALIYGIWFN